MVHTTYFNCITANTTNSEINLTYETAFNNIIIESTSQWSMAVIGFSIPNFATPLFTYKAGEFQITRGATAAAASVPLLDWGYGPGVVMNYAQLTAGMNSAFALANTGSLFAAPTIVYDAPSRLFTVVLDPNDTSGWYFNKKLFRRFPTLPADFAPASPNQYAQLRFNTFQAKCVQETQALWALNDYSRLIITAPGLPFDSTMSAVSSSGTPLSIKTLASFENTDMDFNRSAFVYSESGQGNWTLHDLNMYGNLRTLSLQVFAVNLFDEVVPIKLAPGAQAIIKLAFVRDR